jgi:hypothetical protein
LPLFVRLKKTIPTNSVDNGGTRQRTNDDDTKLASIIFSFPLDDSKRHRRLVALRNDVPPTTISEVALI